MLNDITYATLIQNAIATILNNVKFENKNLLWEFIKCEIRTVTISYATKKAKELRDAEVKLERQLCTSETNLDGSDEKFNQYLDLKNKWEHIQTQKLNGSIIRSKAKWVEHGEKNTKYFLNLEKTNFNTKYIRKLILNTGIEISEPDMIIKEQKQFYTDLYQSRIDSANIYSNENIFLNNRDIPELDQSNKQVCESQLTMEDIHKALMSMANDKSPGPDGFTTNFFKFFWPDLRKPLLESYLYSFQNGELADSQRHGLLSLIPKPDKDLCYLKSWRPLSLLATDYKILAKALACKLQKVVGTIVSSDQVGYVKNRFIGENIRIIDDIVLITSQQNHSGIIAIIDFEKAFDTIEWPFLFQTLKAFNFGENFINWIKLLYNNNFSCVSNNGYLSDYFQLNRGIRQGCPISALLFILVAEIIAISIRSEKNIKGITINEEEFKIIQLADDTTLFLKNIKSLVLAIDLFKKFGAFSGLKLNIGKTEIVPLGQLYLTTNSLPKRLKNITIQTKLFKTLGIWFSINSNINIELNFTERLKTIEKSLFIWSARDPSWKGNITIIKSLIIPKFLHLFSSVYTPAKILDKHR